MEETGPGWRALIFAAGPAMNLLLPFVLLPLVYLVGHEVPAYQFETPLVGHVASGSVAEQAGVLVGDRILGVNGRDVADWQELAAALEAETARTYLLRLEREGRVAQVEMRADGGEIGMRPPLEAVIDRVFPGTPAEQAGLRDGDRVVTVDGRPVGDWYVFSDAIDRSQGQPLQLQVLRQGETLPLEITPKLERDRYLVGVSVAREMTLQRHGLFESLQLGAARSVGLIGLTVGFIGDLFAGQVDTDQIGGPVAVFKMTGAAVESSPVETLFILAFLSIQLGILNLLPVPVLDGGHLLFLLPEFLLRRPLPQRLREGLQGVGLVMVLGLMLLAFYNDLTRLL